MSSQAIDSLIIHKVGNKLQQEPLFLSDQSISLNEELSTLLSAYFFNAFQNTEWYQFFNQVELKYNTVYSLIGEMFQDSSLFVGNATSLAKLLYESSMHPKIKGGEFYVAKFSNCVVDGITTDAIGLFKSENKDTFLKIFPNGDHLDMQSESGINIQKLDKGCIVYNVDAENGYKVAVVDKTNKGTETVFWFDDFLGVQQSKDSYFHTDKMIEFCTTFASKALPEQFDVNKADQADILNKSVSYLKEADYFNFDELTNMISEQEDVRASFKNYRDHFEQTNDMIFESDFEISDAALKKKQRYFKPVIKLDKNFSIYVHGNTALLEQGTDELGRKFYKLYYDNEA